MSGVRGQEALFLRLRRRAERYQELLAALADPAVHARPGQMAGLTRELGALASQAAAWERWSALESRERQARQLLDEARQLADAGGEVADLARADLAEVAAARAQLSAEVLAEALSDDPLRGRPLFLEVRAGTGGDEASLFASELLALYVRFCEAQGLGVELVSSQASEVGGLKEGVIGVSGPSAWDLLRFEAGGHRVQRVPATESQGRIHTSAATVAVVPEAEESELQVREADLRIDTYRASGPGGQNVNKTSSAIRITHLPTGTVVQCQDDSSQHKNKSAAMRMLRARLKDEQDRRRKAEEDRLRKAQVGSGDRSERIRTYNFPQDRLTDHRIKTSYALGPVLLGKLLPVVEDLRRHDLETKLAGLDTEPS